MFLHTRAIWQKTTRVCGDFSSSIHQTDRLTQLRPWGSRRREPHNNPKQRTLQPPTLNPSAVMVFSRCHRDVRGEASHRPKPSFDACMHHLYNNGD